MPWPGGGQEQSPDAWGCRGQVEGMEGGIGRFWARNRWVGGPENRAQRLGDAVARWGAWRR
eukprot:340051-Pyramimonas_sp.AAC.1